MKPAVIELQVDKIDELFDTLDPTPFRGRDLDRRAEDYILSWARELTRQVPIRVLIYMPAAEGSGEQAQVLGQAMGQYFNYRAETLTKELAELLLVGRRALLLGFFILALCVVGGQLARGHLAGRFGEMIAEGLVILGWVANWRPIEMFLYDWWPIIRRRNLLRRLARAEFVIALRVDRQAPLS
jgi:hypothetical protein